MRHAGGAEIASLECTPRSTGGGCDNEVVLHVFLLFLFNKSHLFFGVFLRLGCFLISVGFVDYLSC